MERGIMKLNLGSGDCPLDGYFNFDAKNGDSLYPLRGAEGCASHISGSSADEVRASHVLEHFPHGQTLDVLKEWVRVLKPGGWLKIAVPDFDWIVNAQKEAWVLGNTEGISAADLLQSYLMGGQVDGNDYHKAIFTKIKLKWLLEDCGLVNVRPWASEIQDCASLPVSLNLMGQKPEAKTGTNDLSKCQSWDYSGDCFDPRSKGVQCSMPVVDGKFCAKHSGQKPQYDVVMAGDVRERCKGLCFFDGHDTCRKCGYKIDLTQSHSTYPQKTSTSRTQVFAAGRWQDLEGEVQCATQEEIDAANAGQLQTRTIVSDGKRDARIALCLSTPRQGFLRPFERLLALAHQAGISLFSGDGVFFHHAMSRSIRNAIEFDFEDGTDGFDFILTADYDTYAMIEDIRGLTELLARSPEADCLVPLQMKRGGTGEILAGGQNMNLTQPLVPIETGHFGLTLFRKSFFERMPKPWFYEKADAEGHWGDGRIDADIGFWLNAKKAKLNVMLAPQIVCGHGEELITYPRIENGKAVKVYQAVNDWLNVRTKPEGIGVQ
jgi:hypothetical protein